MKCILSCVAILFISHFIQAQAYTDSMLVKLNKLPKTLAFNLDSSVTELKKQFSADKPNIVMFFSPDCSHCQEEIQTISKNMDTLSDINFILVTNRQPFLIKEFIKKYNLAGFKNMKFITDDKNGLIRYFGISSNPSMFFFNKDKKCIAGYNSSTVPLSIMLKHSKGIK